MRRLAVSLLALGFATAACTAAKADGTPDERATGDVPRVASVVHEFTLPAGTRLPVVLETTVGSDISRPEQPVRAHVARSIVVDGREVVAPGAQVMGVVSDATRSGRVKGRAHVSVRFTSLVPRGGDERYQIDTAAIGRTAPGTKKNDALKIAAPAAGGALVGALVGGKKGAAIGTAVGGGTGTAVVLSTRGPEVRMGRGTVVTLRLTAPLTIRTS